MATPYFQNRLKRLVASYEDLITRPNIPQESSNGVYERFSSPVLTRNHIPLTWRYDFNDQTNPFLQERLGINSAFNAGAIEWNGKICLISRIEGIDRKSFFGIAESENGVDNFRYRSKPLVITPLDDKETNIYDMRLTVHEDGWIYGMFCVEKHDDDQPGNPSAATAKAGVVRTKDLENWERLPDVTSVYQQRNVVLHPEFVNGKYALYTRPSEGFIDTGKGNGIGWALIDSMENATITEETIIDPRVYHTVQEVKNGQGPTPIKTAKGWLHIPHGVRGHACGLRYVLYSFLTDLADPSKVIHHPGGHFISALGYERVGDTTGNIFCNGMVKRDNGDVFIYYGGSDTRTHVVKSTVEKLLDYVINTPEDAFRTADCVQQRIGLIDKNEAFIRASSNPLLKSLL